MESIFQKNSEFQELEKQWYSALNNNSVDYSVYDHELYFCDVWACWLIYSRKYLLSINSNKSMATKDDHGNWYNMKSIVDFMGNIKSVADLGCSFGYTTAGLKEIFSNAEVYGTNFKDTIQFQVASEISREYNFKLVGDIKELPKIDLVFASEYFEHIHDPVNHLSDIIQLLQPRYFLIANSFGADAIGHFNVYQYNNKPIHSSKIGRIFNDFLRYKGYWKVPTKLWNNRPQFWMTHHGTN